MAPVLMKLLELSTVTIVMLGVGADGTAIEPELRRAYERVTDET